MFLGEMLTSKPMLLEKLTLPPWAAISRMFLLSIFNFPVHPQYLTGGSEPRTATGCQIIVCARLACV